MPIQKVISILINDSGTHFDGNIVEKFLLIPLNKIIQVFMTENNWVCSPEDNSFLENYNLRFLYDNFENPDSQNLIQVFNKYYIGVDVNE